LSRRPLPFIVVDDFVGKTRTTQLLRYAIAQESGFAPSKVALAHAGMIDESRRVSKVNSNVAPVMALVEPVMQKAVVRALRKLGLVNVDSFQLEPELTWCGDGGFFKTHTDTLYRDRFANQRVMTVIHYFYKEPKAFSGGQLRLYGLGSEAGRCISEVEPRFDRAIFFPAWFPHEVLPVRCRSRAFADGRFAISCWVRKSAGRS
jgi:SM-20-related protein